MLAVSILNLHDGCKVIWASGPRFRIFLIVHFAKLEHRPDTSRKAVQLPSDSGGGRGGGQVFADGHTARLTVPLRPISSKTALYVAVKGALAGENGIDTIKCVGLEYQVVAEQLRIGLQVVLDLLIQGPPDLPRRPLLFAREAAHL